MKTKTLAMIALSMLTLSFGLVGCGNGEQSIQQKADSAIVLSFDEFNEMKEDNPARAKNEYDGKVVKYHGFVGDINANRIILGERYVLGDTLACPFSVYLPTEVIAELNKGDEITVVGTFEYKNGSQVSEINDAEIVEE